jgi:hypothetical protein
LAAANFGGSRHADLLVGVPHEDFGGLDAAGAAQVIYGSARGLTSARNKLFTQNSPGITSPAEAGDQFGWSMTAGDFGRSGYADAAIGSLEEAIGPLVEAGVVHILFGTAGGLTSSRSQMWSQNSRGVPGSAREADLFGWSLAAANFGRDSHDDLAVGVPFKSSSTKGAQFGTVIVLHGSDSGLTPAGGQAWSQDSPGIKEVAEGGDFFGISLAAANLGKTGHADLAVGVAEFIRNVSSGAVNVIYGSAKGLTPAGDQFWTQASPGLQGDSSQSARFGVSVAAGNFGRSRQADLAIGDPGVAVGNAESAGVVHTVYGSATGLTAAGNQLWSLATPNILGEPENFSGFGSNLLASP